MLEGLEVTILTLNRLENFWDFSSEYYLKDYLKKSKEIRNLKPKTLGELCYITDGEHGSPEWDDESQIKYITAEYIRANYIQDGDFKTISEKQDKRNARARLLENDVLIYSVGAYAGNTAVAEKHLFPANIPRSVAIARPIEDIKSQYISVFLNSDFGTFQTKRFRAGNSQPVLALEKIRQFEIPILDRQFQLRVTEIYDLAYALRINGQQKYSQSELVLLESLGLKSFKPSQESVNIKSFSTSFVQSGRLDAEYYQPKYEEARQHIVNTGNYVTLGQILTTCQRGKQPKYLDDGEEGGLTVINSKHVRHGKVIADDNRKAIEYEDALKITRNDVLVNGTGVGTIGRSAIYQYEHEALPDNHVTILRTKALDPYYLMTFLNSPLGQLQVEKFQKGSSGQIELYPNDIEQFYVWMAPEHVQTEIRARVIESFELEQKSTTLLETAKRAVEIAIEKDEKEALQFIEDQLKDSSS